MEESSIVCSLTWVRKGFAKKVPRQYQMSEAEMTQMNNDPEIKQKKKEMEVEDLADYDEGDNLPIFAAEANEDLEKTGHDNYPAYFEEDSEEEKEDYTIKDTDALILAGKMEKNEFSSLEIYLFEEPTLNLFVHHDITLSSFPLSIDWLSVAPSTFQDTATKKGNYAVIGSFLPEIEIWDLDTLDVLEPSLVLGGMQEAVAKKRKGPKSFRSQPELKPDSHADAVLSVNLNAFRKEILASGSADTTVKLWDLTSGKNVITYNHHKDKVQSVRWHPTEETVLFSGAFDKKIHIFDAKQNQDSLTIKLPSEIECATWDHLNPTNIYVSTEDGSLLGYDARNNGAPLFSVKAHKKAATTVSASYGVNGMVTTASLDGLIKLWDVQTITNGEPLLIIEKNFKAGKLNCGSFYQDNPWLASFGTNRGELVIWDVRENDNVANYFAPRAVAAGN